MNSHDSSIVHDGTFRVNSKPRTSPGFSQSAFLATRIPRTSLRNIQPLGSMITICSYQRRQAKCLTFEWSSAIDRMTQQGCMREHQLAAYLLYQVNHRSPIDYSQSKSINRNWDLVLNASESRFGQSRIRIRVSVGAECPDVNHRTVPVVKDEPEYAELGSI